MGSAQLTVQLPSGTQCTGGANQDLCLVSFVTAGGFGNCIAVSQNAAAAATNGTTAATGATAANGTTTATGATAANGTDTGAATAATNGTTTGTTGTTTGKKHHHKNPAAAAAAAQQAKAKAKAQSAARAWVRIFDHIVKTHLKLTLRVLCRVPVWLAWLVYSTKRRKW